LRRLLLVAPGILSI